jgi:hypothetical protein
MPRQERVARRAKRAVADANKIIAQATNEARAKRFRCTICKQVGPQGGIPHLATCSKAQKPATPTRVAKPAPRPSPASSGGSVDLAARVREMRDGGGMAWRAIGIALELEGSNNGAGTARKLYAQTNGGTVPRTHAPRKGSTPKAQGPGRNGSELDRKIALAEGKVQFTDDMEDEAILDAVKGRVIKWAIDIKALSGGKGEQTWMTEEARVHPVYSIIDEDLARNGSRTLRFREYHGVDPQTGRHLSGPTRTVRVWDIYTVR